MTLPQEKLKLGEVIPYLNLPSNRNESVNLWDLRQRKNLIVIFHHGTNCAQCEMKLKEMAKSYAKANELEGEILAVSFDDLKTLRNFAEETRMPFHLLSDENEETTGQFTYKDIRKNGPLPSIFITDRFGVLRYQKIAIEADELPHSDEILSWLLLIQTECPECSHL